jgi:L-lactate utilization protein LutB
MKHLKTRNQLNEASENLNISDVMSSFLTKLQSRLRELENEKTWDEWDDGVNFGRKDMIEEVMKMVEDLSKNYS